MRRCDGREEIQGPRNDVFRICNHHDAEYAAFFRAFSMPLRRCSSFFKTDKVELSEGTVSPAPRPRADTWGYPDRQWIGFHHTLWAAGPLRQPRLAVPHVTPFWDFLLMQWAPQPRSLNES